MAQLLLVDPVAFPSLNIGVSGWQQGLLHADKRYRHTATRIDDVFNWLESASPVQGFSGPRRHKFYFQEACVTRSTSIQRIRDKAQVQPGGRQAAVWSLLCHGI